MFEGKDIGGSVAIIAVMCLTIAGTWGVWRFFDKRDVPFASTLTGIVVVGVIGIVFLIGKYGFGLQ